MSNRTSSVHNMTAPFFGIQSLDTQLHGYTMGLLFISLLRQALRTPSCSIWTLCKHFASDTIPDCARSRGVSGHPAVWLNPMESLAIKGYASVIAVHVCVSAHVSALLHSAARALTSGSHISLHADKLRVIPAPTQLLVQCSTVHSEMSDQVSVMN